jgi:hypothetical protein
MKLTRRAICGRSEVFTGGGLINFDNICFVFDTMGCSFCFGDLRYEDISDDTSSYSWDARCWSKGILYKKEKIG